MAVPPEVTPDYLQILAARELRKAGFDVEEVHVHRRSELPEPHTGFVVEFSATLSHATWRRRALVACRHAGALVEPDVVQSLAARLEDAKAHAAIIFSTAEFGPAAVAAAREQHVALLRVVDTRTLYDSSGWSTPGHYPAWLPAHTAQAVERDAAGEVRITPLEPGRVEMILNQLGEEPKPGV